jgi:hypothetical protein
MTQPKDNTTEGTALIAVQIVPHAKELLSIEELARAIGLHVKGEFHSYRHRLGDDSMRQQVQLETIHETANGQKFRVVTEYHEALTVVDLVEERMDRSNTH